MRSRTVGRTALGALPLFAGCRNRDLRRLGTLGTQVSVRVGQPLMMAGARGTEVILVLHGVATCEVGGREVAQFEVGDFFGEIATLDGRPRTATVTAKTDMEVIVLERAEFDQVLDLSPQVGQRILVAMAKRLRAANELVGASS